MPRRNEVTRKAAVEELVRESQRPSLILVTSHLLVHVPRSGPGVCPCCKSECAGIEEDRPDLEVLIDTQRSRRWRRDRVADVGIFDEMAAQADLKVDMPLRCTPETIGIVLSNAWTTLASGASRSGKTQAGCVWCGRQWMLRGGRNVLACVLGPELKQAHIIKKKLVEGTDSGAPPIFDSRLVEQYPDHPKSDDQRIHLADGTKILLQHTKTDGRNLAGESWAWYQWTEAAKTTDPGNFGQARGRLVSSNGAGFMDAVPEASHWLRRGVIEPAAEEAEARIDGTGVSERPEYATVLMPVERNPWNLPDTGEKFKAALAKVDPRMADRYGGAEWVGDRNKTFAEYFDASKHTFESEGWGVESLGLVDITRQAILSRFRRDHDWLIAVDVNADPHTALIGKIAISARHLENHPMAYTNPDLWVGVFFDCLQVWKADSDEAAQRLKTIHNGRFAGAAIVMDASSSYRKHNAGGVRNARKGYVPKAVYEAHGFEVVAPSRTKNGFPANPDRFDSSIKVRRLMRFDKLLFNRLRCRKPIEAIRDQESEPDGITPMRASSTWADRHVISCTDTLRYWTWPFFPVGLDEKAPPQIRVHA